MKKKIGLYVRVKGGLGIYLKDLFANIKLRDDIIWKISCNQFWDSSYNPLFNKALMENSEFQSKINTDQPYFALSGIIQAFDKKVSNVYKFSQFLKSSCVLTLVIADAEFYEIYAKDAEILSLIKKNAECMEVVEIEDIYLDENQDKNFSI